MITETKSRPNLDAIIQRSHERSAKYGVDPHQSGAPESVRLTSNQIQKRIEKQHEFYALAREQLDSLYRLLKDTGFCMALADKDGYVFDAGPVLPQSRGWVKLAGADPLLPPRILLNGLSSERDRAEFRRCIEMTREIAAQKAFDFCRGPEVSPGPAVVTDSDIDAYVRANANSAYHPCGSCKIGSDEMAVVDSQLRVHGIDGLRVVDASVMPSITNGNINAPSMMIGERAADLIAAAS
jgi:choline dehydrogenase-like flavoprotein